MSWVPRLKRVAFVAHPARGWATRRRPAAGSVGVESGREGSCRRARGPLLVSGNRQLNSALHRLAITKGRLDPETIAYLTRKQAEGKTRREAIRCLKRHLARRVWHLLQPNPATTIHTSTPTPRTRGVTIHCNTPTGTLDLT
jgi:hypothetical protein